MLPACGVAAAAVCLVHISVTAFVRFCPGLACLLSLKTIAQTQRVLAKYRAAGADATAETITAAIVQSFPALPSNLNSQEIALLPTCLAICGDVTAGHQ
jgi:hypothetical protein